MVNSTPPTSPTVPPTTKKDGDAEEARPGDRRAGAGQVGGDGDPLPIPPALTEPHYYDAEMTVSEHGEPVDQQLHPLFRVLGW
ncbi:hypothetical protein GCM10029964_058640 [Kibdelosporangium lantanae]